MSERIVPADQTKLWWVWRLHCRGGHLFAGDLRAAVDHITALRDGTGAQHATMEMRGR
jgi:hypothetical protein